jgi:hypothetical protein
LNQEIFVIVQESISADFDMLDYSGCGFGETPSVNETSIDVCKAYPVLLSDALQLMIIKTSHTHLARLVSHHYESDNRSFKNFWMFL